MPVYYPLSCVSLTGPRTVALVLKATHLATNCCTSILPDTFYHLNNLGSAITQHNSSRLQTKCCRTRDPPAWIVTPDVDCACRSLHLSKSLDLPSSRLVSSLSFLARPRHFCCRLLSSSYGDVEKPRNMAITRVLSWRSPPLDSTSEVYHSASLPVEGRGEATGSCRAAYDLF